MWSYSASNITCDSCFEVIGDDSDQIKSVGDDFEIKNKKHLSRSEIKNLLDNNDDNTDIEKNTESSLSEENDEEAEFVSVKVRILQSLKK